MNTKLGVAGFSLIELMIVVAIIAIIAATAGPYMQETVEKRRATAAAEALKEFVLFARSEAIKQSRNVRVAINAGSGFVGASEGTTNCTGAADCVLKIGGTDTTQLYRVAAYPDVALAQPSGEPNNVTFNSRGLVVGSASTMINTSLSPWALRVVVNPIGRVTVCHPVATGNKNPGGYASC